MRGGIKSTGKLDKFLQHLKRGLEIPDDEGALDKNASESNSGLAIQDLTPEREQEIIDQLASRIKRMKMGTPAAMMLGTFEPVNRVVGQLYGFYAAPFMELFGIRGYDYALFFGKKKNVKELLRKIREEEGID